jgi:hypothetical protein
MNQDPVRTMSDQICIEKGCPPWRPSRESNLSEVLHHFTIPLVGIIEQAGVAFAFWCVVGHAGPDNAWAYARVREASDLAEVREANNETFDDALRRLVDGRVSAFAIASDERGVVEWVSVEPPASFADAHERGMEELGTKLQEAMSEMESLMEQFPSLRAASSFPIAPSLRS